VSSVEEKLGEIEIYSHLYASEHGSLLLWQDMLASHSLLAYSNKIEACFYQAMAESKARQAYGANVQARSRPHGRRYHSLCNCRRRIASIIYHCYIANCCSSLAKSDTDRVG